MTGTIPRATGAPQLDGPSVSPPKLRWGLLSTARANEALLQSDPGRERFVAVASRDRRRAERYARDHELAHAYGSYDAMLRSDLVDAVYISVPNSCHIEWSLRALSASKHVLCEKPFSSDPDDVARCFDEAERRGLVCAEALMWRHHPQVHYVRELLDANGIGRPQAIHAEFFPGAALAPGDIRHRSDLGGGALFDLGCYCVDGLRTLAAAEPIELVGLATSIPGGRFPHAYMDSWAGGTGGEREDDVDYGYAGVLRFPDGVLGTFQCGFFGPDRQALSVVGTEGSIEIHDPWHARGANVTYRRGSRTERRTVGLGVDAYELELLDVEAAAAGMGPQLLAREQTVAQAAALGELLLASRRV